MEKRTLCAQGESEPPPSSRPVAPPIVPSSAFVYPSQAAVDEYFETGQGYLYSRNENPTVRTTERLIARLEGAEEAALFASGMAAISTVFLTLASRGEKVAVQREIYGGTAALLREVLPDTGLEIVWISLDEMAQLDPRRIAGCKMLYIETPANPVLRLVDLRQVAGVAATAGVPLVVDGTFAPPVLQQPLELGCELVVHSATKYLGGHSDLLGGVVSGSRATVSRVTARRRLLGGILDPFQAFLLHRGIRTLAVRMDAHCRNAEAVARALEQHPAVETVMYPWLESHSDHALARRQMTGGGGMVSFRVRGTREFAESVHDRLRLFARVGTLGGVESLVSIPARMSHRSVDVEERNRAGITDTLIRLSVGIEAADDLIADLHQALEHTP